MLERDEEQEFDLDAGEKLFVGEEGVKKKSKAKAKTKKKEEPEVKITPKSMGSQFPLSLQEASPEDIAQYELRLSSQKNLVAQAQTYAMSMKLKAGEVIKHKKFGIGFVLAENGPHRVEVLFETGRKLLVNDMK